MEQTLIQIVRSRVVVQSSGCWSWVGPRTSTGHGHQSFKQQKFLVHRWVYELLIGNIEAGHKLHHFCENPPCINPSHVTPVTQRLHMLVSPNNPARANKLKTRCINGHELAGDNIRWFKKNGAPVRYCKTCNREAARRYAARIRASLGGK